MAMTISELEPHDAVAVYKASGIDIRKYDNLQLFVHGEALLDNASELKSGDLSVFIRLGKDYKDNYYEYEVPLQITPPGKYNNNSAADRLKVWPKESMIDLYMKKLTTLKKERNTEKNLPHSRVSSVTTLYSKDDPDKPGNKMTVIGNPSLSDVSVIMIGVRNKSDNDKSGKVWVNELRMNGIDEEGGWAAKANATLRISDLATVNASGSYTSYGFGSIEQSSAERSLSTNWDYSVSGQTDIGKWLPEQAKITAPFYYSRSKSVNSPKYDPYNEDLTLSETLDTYSTESQKDSIRNITQTVDEYSSFSLSGVKVNIKSKHSKSENKKKSKDPTTEYERENVYKGSMNYNWNPYFKPWKPFSSEGQSKKKKADEEDKTNSFVNKQKILKEFQLNWLPNNISFSTNINRSYFEQQLRNIEGSSTEYEIPVTVSKRFTWLRQLNITWDLTKNLKMNFNSSTNARINEPDTPVNKQLYPTEYEAWKDTVMMQLWKLGTPIDYDQKFDITWNVPINKISFTDWITTTLKYRSTYQWNKGTTIDEFTETGNTVQNNAQWQIDGRLNFETLYNKFRYLKKANQKYRITNSTTPKKKNDNEKKKSTRKSKESTMDNALLYGTRFLMMLRSLQVNYKRTKDTYIPSFRPNVGDVFGQGNVSGSGLAPGLGFAFGFEGGETYTEKAMENGWLIVNDSITTPAVYSVTEDFSYQAVLEPLPGLKINLTGTRRSNERQSHQFMFPNLNITRGGSFQQTAWAFGDSFDDMLVERLSGNPFPGIFSTMPNWNAKYDGLMNIIPSLSKWFKTISFSHAYNCTYNVGNYQTFPDKDVMEISSATVTQSFAPLIGLNATLNNNITAKAEYKTTKSGTYNTSTTTITRNSSRDLTIGVGYKIADLNTRIGLF